MHKVVLVMVLCLLFMCACTSQSDSNSISSDVTSSDISSEMSQSDVHDEPTHTITLETPLPLATGRSVLANGTEIEVTLEMTEGSYNADGQGWMAAYTGTFQFRTKRTDNHNDGDDSIVTSLLDGSKYSFAKPFALLFDDYNGDGNPDFAIGQWGASVWRRYEIFTIMPNGEVKKLMGDDIISAESRDHSAVFHKVSPTSFSTLMDFGRIDESDYEWLKLRQEDIDDWVKATGYAYISNVEIFYEWQCDEFKIVKSLPYDMPLISERRK